MILLMLLHDGDFFACCNRCERASIGVTDSEIFSGHLDRI